MLRTCQSRAALEIAAPGSAAECPRADVAGSAVDAAGTAADVAVRTAVDAV